MSFQVDLQRLEQLLEALGLEPEIESEFLAHLDQFL
jgi:hypothetical protein